jgi:hypothetical protein
VILDWRLSVMGEVQAFDTSLNSAVLALHRVVKWFQTICTINSCYSSI